MKDFLKYLPLLLITYTSFLVQSQEISKESSYYIRVAAIDSLIELENYDLALAKIDDLESYSNYYSINNINRFNLQLKKAKCYYNLEQEEKAIKILLDGREELNSSNLVKELSIESIEYSKFLGRIFSNDKYFSKSRDYYKEALETSKLSNDTLNIISSLRSIGLAFHKEGIIDSALYYSKSAIKYPTTSSNQGLMSKIYNDLSIYLQDKDSLKGAEYYGNKSLEIREKLRDSIATVYALVNLSNILYKKGEFDKVEKNYIKAYETVKNINESNLSTLKENLLYNIAYVNEELGNFEGAYSYLLKATELTDSLAEVKVAQNISEIEAKYNVEKQAAETEREKSKRQQAQFLFYGTALAFIAILALGYIFYRNYRLKQQTKLDHLENESQTKIINATIDAKEKERKAIAETLHDSVSALLSSANLHLQATKAQLKQKSPQEITKAQTIVNEASVKIRDLSHELISSVLLKFGLAFAVHDMCQKYSNSEITLHSDDDGIKRYHQDFEIKIHNIIEELINNILKHSKANNATIMLAHKENDMLSVRISDDGVGFNPRLVRGKDGLGLSHIEARIKVMKGVFNIISSKDNGTNIFILVPIQFKESSVSA